MRRLLFNLHLVVGLSLGLLIAVMGLTGSLLVFRHEIDRVLYPHLLRAAPEQGGQSVPLQAVLETVRKADSGRAINYVFVARSAEETHELWLNGGALRVYVHPGTGRILGALNAERTPTGWLSALHTKLLSGETGERIIGYGGLGLLFLSLSGIVLWWPSRVRQLKERLRVKWDASGKRVNFDLHRSGGFYVAGLLALMALTGTSLAFGEWFTEAAHRLTRTPPRPKAPVVSASSDEEPLPLDVVVRTANQALPAGEITRIALPSAPNAPLVVRKRLPGEMHPNGMSFIFVDPYRGRVLRLDSARHAAAGPRLLNLRYPLHIGLYGEFSRAFCMSSRA